MSEFELDVFSPAVEAKYQQALVGLAANTRRLLDFPQPVLIEGGAYPGIWLECGPLEGAVYGRFFPEVAIANHEIFFHYQREDGWLPYNIRADNRVGFSQIQMVVPIAATAWETAQATGREDFLARAYQACARWDAWLLANRNTRGAGLCELFCEFDTGHDNSPRVRGLPRTCPGGDARNCADVRKLPWLAPDLSATVYGGRAALAAMAEALGRRAEAADWQERAESLRGEIVRSCYDPQDEFFYDVDREGSFNRVRGDVITRVFGEHVPDRVLFERMYRRHIKAPQAFWTPYPLPSIAANDPSFDRDLPLNSWGGASQALTALRAPRWMDYYGKSDDLVFLMTRWVTAILQAAGFQQQMNPWTGKFSTSPGYSPAMCVFIDFVDRLRALGGSTKS
jgi:hypothetical protein